MKTTVTITLEHETCVDASDVQRWAEDLGHVPISRKPQRGIVWLVPSKIVVEANQP